MLLPDMTPGTRRALAAAHAWSSKLGSASVSAVHTLLGLLAEEEGKPTQLFRLQHVEPAAILTRLEIPNLTVEIPEDYPAALDAYLQQLLYEARLLALELTGSH